MFETLSTIVFVMTKIMQILGLGILIGFFGFVVISMLQEVLDDIRRRK